MPSSNLSDEELLSQKGYTLGPILGRGSYGTVNKAFMKAKRCASEEDQQVAMKIISLDEVPLEFKTKFLNREIAISRVLHHPNIIRALEVIEAKRRIFLPLEFAPRGDLLDYVRLRGPLGERKIAQLFSDICAGLKYIHSRNVVHRDLKCENILLSSDGTAKLADFGFARRQKENDLSRTFCGSAAYAAPELLTGVPYRGVMADVWSLGVVLFIMACGMMPFRDNNIKTLVSDQKKVLKYPLTLEVPLTASLKDLLQGLLTADLTKRLTLPGAMNHPWTALNASYDD